MGSAPDMPCSVGTERPIDPRNIEVIDRHTVEMLRALTPEQRLLTGSGMYRSARLLIEASLKQQHPSWNQQQIGSELKRRFSHGSA